MDLSPTFARFVLHWGEMGTRWGVNRTVAQIHALLYLDRAGRCTPTSSCETLDVARSNVSTSLRELQGWGPCERDAMAAAAPSDVDVRRPQRVGLDEVRGAARPRRPSAS